MKSRMALEPFIMGFILSKGAYWYRHLARES